VNPETDLNLGLRYDYQKLPIPKSTIPSAALAAIGLSTTTPVRDQQQLSRLVLVSVMGLTRKLVVAAVMEFSSRARRQSCWEQRLRRMEFRSTA